MEDTIARRSFLVGAGAATTAVAAAAALSTGVANAADKNAATIPATATPPAPPPKMTAQPAGEPSDAVLPDGEELLALFQVIQAAQRKLSTENWNYLTAASETGTTQARNRQALDSIALRPRMLRNITKIDTSGTLLGQKMRMPVILCGTGSPQKLHPGGAAEYARAAAKFGVPYGVGSLAKPSLEETAKAGGTKLYQLYVNGDQDWVDKMAARAIAAGYNAFGFTVDSPVYSRREVDITTHGHRATESEHVNPYRAGLDWDQIKRFKDNHKDLPIFIKGLTSGEDADMACQVGCSVVWLSTHGGRQADHGRGSLDILPEVVDAVQGRAEIIVDSGVCRGTDVVKALAMGANVVGIGKLYSYGLAANGEAGVTRVLELLETEIRESLGLIGITKIDQLNKSTVHPAMPVVQPNLFSAFPLLKLT